MIALIGITIERNVTSSRMNARLSTNRNTIGRCDFIVSRKSFDEAVMPLTATSASSLPTVAGTTSSRRTRTDSSEAASVPLPWTASDTTATVLSGLTSTPEGSDSLPVAIALSCSSLDGGLDLGRGDVLGLDHDVGRRAAAGEGRVDAVERLDDRLAAGHALGAGLLELHAERGDRQGDEQAAGEDRRDERARQDAVEDGVPHARLALGLVAALGDVGHAALLEPALLARGRTARRAGT